MKVAGDGEEEEEEVAQGHALGLYYMRHCGCPGDEAAVLPCVRPEAVPRRERAGGQA